MKVWYWHLIFLVFIQAEFWSKLSTYICMSSVDWATSTLSSVNSISLTRYMLCSGLTLNSEILKRFPLCLVWIWTSLFMSLKAPSLAARIQRCLVLFCTENWLDAACKGTTWVRTSSLSDHAIFVLFRVPILNGTQKPSPQTGLKAKQ